MNSAMLKRITTELTKVIKRKSEIIIPILEIIKDVFLPILSDIIPAGIANNPKEIAPIEKNRPTNVSEYPILKR